MNEIDYEVRKTRAIAFVNALRRLDSPGRRSMLDVPESEAFAAKFVAKHVVKGRSIKAQLAEINKLAAVARLWAEHDKDDGRGTIGEALGRSCGHQRSAASAAEAYLHRVTSPETVAELLDEDGPLADVVFKLKQAGVAVNWPRLLIDLDGWNLKNREIQARWAKDFFQTQRGKVAESA